MHTAFNILYGLFITLLLLVGGLFLASVLPIPGAIELKIVQSGSMEPSIPLGALVVIKPAATYGVEDVITFAEDSGAAVPTTHRIVSVRQEGSGVYYETKGDANEEADPRETARSDVIGKVVFSLPFAGFIIDFARKPLGFLLLIGLPAFVIVVDELVTIVREVAKLRRRKVMPQLRPPQPRVTYRIGDEIVLRRAVSPLKKVSLRRAYAGVLSLLYIACASLAVLSGGIAGTVSYFSDTEQSLNNTFTAGEWLSSEALIVEEVTEEEESSLEEPPLP